MKIRTLQLSKTHLKLFPDSEQLLVFVGGHIRNEVACLEKLLLRAVHTDAASQMESDGNVSQSFLLLRVLAGKLYEGRRFLKKNFDAKLAAAYAKVLPEDRLTAYEDLKAYFDSPSPQMIKLIRDRLAFHYATDGILHAINGLDDNEILRIYIANVGINVFYGASDRLVTETMLATVDGMGGIDAVRVLTSEILEVARKFNLFIDAAITEALKRNLPAAIFDEAPESELELKPADGMPYFCGLPYKDEGT